MNKKVLSFGEILLRICPDTDGRWLAANSLPFYVGGAELNVATALALWRTPSAYLTALPENSMSQQLAGYMKEKGIDTSHLVYQGARLGLYFLPQGKDLKNAGVIYDRAGSSFAGLQPGDIDWDSILENVSWLHFSAISPALSRQAADVCLAMLKAASAKKHVTISVDLNYRAKLWQYGADPISVMPELVQYCDVVMGNLWAAEKMLGIPVDTNLTGTDLKEDYLKHAQLSSEAILKKFPRVKHVAKTFRFDKGDGGIRYYTCFFNEGRLYTSKEYTSEKILDKVGSGDCFMAGLIQGLYHGQSIPDTLEYATAAAFQKLFIPSDATDQRPEDIKKFMSTYER